MTTYETADVRVFRLPTGVELVSALTDYCEGHNIAQAQVLGLGAVRTPRIGRYAFQTETYHDFVLEGEWELLALNANVSLKDGEPFVHAHAMLGDAEGQVRGGHLFAAEVLVAEITLTVLAGPPQERVTDPETGLSLWSTE